MRIQLLGSAKEVSGSMSILEVGGLKLLIDCGIIQTNDFVSDMKVNYNVINFDVKTIDYVILTHAHSDHIGLVPLLYKKGYSNPILCTDPTMMLSEISLLDSAFIWNRECEKIKKNGGKYRGKLANDIKPLYSTNDALGVMSLFRGYGYDKEIILNDKVKIKFKYAGHILGAASIEIYETENFKTKKTLFTGDFSGFNDFHPFIKGTDKIDNADYVICETTYGNKKHKKENPIKKLNTIIQDTCIERKKTVLIASFSIQRLQELIWYLYHLYKDNPRLNDIPIYIDAPMGTKVIRNAYEKLTEFYNNEAKELGENIFRWDKLTYTTTPEQSASLRNGEPKIIISSAGMMQAGRIIHHIESFIPSKGCCVVLTGYCAIGTFGRRLYDCYHSGKTEITNLNGKEMRLKCVVEKMEGLSGHADKDSIVEYLKNIKGIKKIILNHGEIEAIDEMKDEIKKIKSCDIIVPNKNQIINLD